ncbi:MAG: EI24 domain-containing protein [Pseudomonadota bacterium]|nr:EI24 domain-containing protein [Pseudomonadota bacterium]
MGYAGFLAQGFGCLRRPPFLWLMAKSAALSLGIVILVTAVVVLMLGNTTILSDGNADLLLDAAGVIMAGAGMVYFFPVITVTVVAVFADEVAALVEAQDYPDLPPVCAPSLTEQVLSGLKVFGMALSLNVLALPVSFFLPFVPLVLNGFLLGREYFGDIALRHLSPEDAGTLRGLNSFRIWLCGIVLALLSWVPVLNLVMPVVGTVFMVHVFHHLRQSAIRNGALPPVAAGR